MDKAVGSFAVYGGFGSKVNLLRMMFTFNIVIYNLLIMNKKIKRIKEIEDE